MDARIRAAEIALTLSEKAMINAKALDEIGLPGAAAEYRKEANVQASRAEDLLRAAAWKPKTTWSERPDFGPVI